MCTETMDSGDAEQRSWWRWSLTWIFERDDSIVVVRVKKGEVNNAALTKQEWMQQEKTIDTELEFWDRQWWKPN